MKTAHSVHARVFCHENEDESLVLSKFLEIFPFDFKDEKIELKSSNAYGFSDKKIVVFEAVLAKESHVSKFIDSLADKIDDAQKRKILSEAESRLDDNIDFFLRFDKKEYLKNNKLVLTDSGNCFHIKISIAAFPKKREVGLKIVREIFNK